MRNRFVISESDRRSILSMYGVLTEENTTRIVGKVFTRQNYHSFDRTFSTARNLELNLYGNNQDESYENLGDENNLDNMELISTTKTDIEGKFIFDDITDYSDLIISFEGNDFFEPVNYEVKNIIRNKDNNVNFNVEYKEKEEKINDTKVKKEKIIPVEKCKKKDSNNSKIYGYGEYIVDGYSGFLNDPNTNEEKLIDSSSKIALKDAIDSYLTIIENKNIKSEKLYDFIIKMLGTPELEKLKIICKKTYVSGGKVGATSVVKFKKSLLDEILKKLIDSEKPIEVERKINFDDIDFQKALEYSFDFKRKIFLFFCTENDDCNSLLKNFVILGDLDKKLNNWVRLFYKVDRSQSTKYVVASESLKINTYPTVIILEAIKDPRKNYIKDSIKIIKKITSFDETISGMSNLLN